jgi:hypothetical protein
MAGTTVSAALSENMASCRMVAWCEQAAEADTSTSDIQEESCGTTPAVGWGPASISAETVGT